MSEHNADIRHDGSGGADSINGDEHDDIFDDLDNIDDFEVLNNFINLN
jgi:hypothetical protein